MNGQALSSISFVISVVYTATFANAAYLMTVDPRATGPWVDNIAFSAERVVCGIIAIVMALRFFFGNNQYIADIIADRQRGPWVKFYQFIFIAAQSVILLVATFYIPSPRRFVCSMAVLFGVEVFWYLLTFLVDRPGVWPPEKADRLAFAIAEATNLAFAIVALAAYLWWEGSVHGGQWLWVVSTAFGLNTAYDLHKNMPGYMSA